MKMFEYVSEKYSEEYVKGKDWYHKKQWTQQQEDHFKKWLVDYLTRTKQARKELIWSDYKSKQVIEKAADMFILSYWWKTKCTTT